MGNMSQMQFIEEPQIQLLGISLDFFKSEENPINYHQIYNASRINHCTVIDLFCPDNTLARIFSIIDKLSSKGENMRQLSKK